MMWNPYFSSSASSSMASCTLSASTTRNSGQYDPPISISHALPHQPPGLMTGMSFNSWPWNVAEAVIVPIVPSGEDQFSTPGQAVSGGVRVGRRRLAVPDVGVPLQPVADPQPGERFEDVEGNGGEGDPER